MSDSAQFASSVRTLNDAPEPLRDLVRQRLGPGTVPQLLVFNPPFVTMGVRRPSTLLAVTEAGWALAADEVGGGPGVASATFEDTLLVELTTILLYGHFKLDFVCQGAARSVGIEFGAVMDRLYRAAVELVLQGVERPAVAARVPASPEPWHDAPTLAEAWPMHFTHALTSSRLPGRWLVAAVQWPAIRGGFRRELAPGAALVVTDRELVLIAEERAKPWEIAGDRPKYGSIVTYFPLTRLAKVHREPHERFVVIGLEMHARHGGERLDVLIPIDHEDAVRRALAIAVPGAPGI